MIFYNLYKQELVFLFRIMYFLLYNILISLMQDYYFY